MIHFIDWLFWWTGALACTAVAGLVFTVLTLVSSVAIQALAFTIAVARKNRVWRDNPSFFDKAWQIIKFFWFSFVHTPDGIDVATFVWPDGTKRWETVWWPGHDEEPEFEA